VPQWYEKQIGPLPAGIWVGVVAAGVGISYVVNRKAKGSSGASAPATDALTSATDGAFGSLPAGTNLGGLVTLPSGVPAGQVSYVGVPGAGSTNTTITDNNSWYRQATNMLLAKGYDAGLVDTALRAYLSGAALTAAQQAVVNLALQLLGAPPFPVVSAPVTNPTPTPTQKYGPIYPQSAPGVMPSDTTCPPSNPYLLQSGSGYTCLTKSEWDQFQNWIHSLP